jgi:hypothetical protein
MYANVRLLLPTHAGSVEYGYAYATNVQVYLFCA